VNPEVLVGAGESGLPRRRLDDPAEDCPEADRIGPPGARRQPGGTCLNKRLGRLDEFGHSPTMLVYAVVDDSLAPTSPLGDSLDVFLRREDAERFIEEVRQPRLPHNRTGSTFLE
jgi:hypothetical protein